MDPENNFLQDLLDDESLREAILEGLAALEECLEEEEEQQRAPSPPLEELRGFSPPPSPPPPIVSDWLLVSW